MKRLMLAALPLLMLWGCAGPPSGMGGSGATGVGAGVRPATLPQCVRENETCGVQSGCCQGLVCVPSGRYGSLCRQPFPG